MGSGCKSRGALKKHIIWGNVLTGHEWLLSLCKVVYGAKRWIVFKRVRGTKRAEFVDGKTAVVPRCKVRFLTYPFQRTAISGNSFHSLKSCCVGFNGRNAHPQANNTWWIETIHRGCFRGQRWQVRFLHATIWCMLRQHPFHYASRSLRYRGAAFKENYVCKTMWLQ